MSKSKRERVRTQKQVEVRDLKQINPHSAGPKGGTILAVNGGGNTPNGPSATVQDPLRKISS